MMNHTTVKPPIELVQLAREYRRLHELWLICECSTKRLEIIHQRYRKARAAWFASHGITR